MPFIDLHVYRGNVVCVWSRSMVMGQIMGNASWMQITHA